MTSIPHASPGQDRAPWTIRASIAGASLLALVALAGAISGRPPRLELIAQAGPAIQIHLGAALLALGVGAWQLIGPKGTPAHRVLGWTWSIAMMGAAISSFFIRTIFDGWLSPVHILSALTIVSLPAALWAAHRHDVKKHAGGMASLYFGGMVVAGAFTFAPGRLMWQVFFG